MSVDNGCRGSQTSGCKLLMRRFSVALGEFMHKKIWNTLEYEHGNRVIMSHCSLNIKEIICVSSSFYIKHKFFIDFDPD